MMQNIYSYIDENKKRYLEELFEFVRIPSASPLPEYEDQIQACAQFAAKMMAQCGLKTTVYQTAGNPIVYGEGTQIPGRPTILIYGHYDVQPEGDCGEWDSPPYQPEIREGRIYGRGVGDNKGQIFAHIKAYEAYCSVCGAPGVNLKYMLEGEEEVGSISLAGFAETHRDLLKADVTIWSDSNVHTSGRPLVILGLKGISSMKITVRGPQIDVHSQWASVLPNPVWKLIRILSALKDENGRVRIPGFYNYQGPGEKEQKAICQIPSDLTAFSELWGSEDFDPSISAEEFFTKYMYEPTLNVGCICAGNVRGSKNIVPAEASCWIDMRLGPGQDSAEMRQAFCDYVTGLGIGSVEIEGTGSDAAFTSLENPFVEPVLQIARESWGLEPIVYPGLGGSGPFHVFNHILNAPCVFIPFADADQHDHAPNENFRVESLMRGIGVAAEMIHRFASVDIH